MGAMLAAEMSRPRGKEHSPYMAMGSVLVGEAASPGFEPWGWLCGCKGFPRPLWVSSPPLSQEGWGFHPGDLLTVGSALSRAPTPCPQ